MTNSVLFRDGMPLEMPEVWRTADPDGLYAALCRLLAYPLDYLEDFAELLSSLWNSEVCPDEQMPLLASRYDMEWDGRADSVAQRDETVKATEVLRERGTIPGLLRRMRKLGFLHAEVSEPYIETFQCDTEGRGFVEGMMLTDDKYTRATFVVKPHGFCARIHDKLWDYIPRGGAMFAEQELDCEVEPVLGVETYLTGDSDWMCGMGDYPFRMFDCEVAMIFEPAT